MQDDRTHMMSPSHPTWLRSIVLVLSASWLSAAVDVQTFWGFDGTVVPDAPNLLSVVVRNDGDRPREGTVVLRAGHRRFTQSEPWVATVYLAPHSSRRVDFAPWLGDSDMGWTLEGSLLDREVEVQAPRRLRPGWVLLVAVDDVGGMRAGLRTFDEDRFPATVSLCDGLGGVVMDHAPRRWTPEQEQALVEWIQAGGVLHLLHGAEGHWPVFGGGLVALAGTAAGQALGRGLIRRHAMQRNDPALEEVVPRQGSRDLPEDDHRYGMGIASHLAQAFARQTRPDHPWWLINLLLIIFLAAVGLGPWLAGRRGLDWRWINLAVVLAILVTAWLMSVIGRRGYGEESSLRSLSLAREIAPGVWDATQWGNLFVTASGRHGVAHAGGHGLYAGIGQEPDPLSIITTGRDAAFQPVIPLFSNRPYGVRLRRTWDAPFAFQDHVVVWTGEARDAPPVAGTVGYLVRGGRTIPLSFQAGPDGRRYAATTAGEDLQAFIKKNHENRYSADRQMSSAAEFHQAMLPQVVAEDLAHRSRLGRPQRDCAYVLVPHLPAPLRAATAAPMRQEGAVIYRITLPSTP